MSKVHIDTIKLWSNTMIITTEKIKLVNLAIERLKGLKIFNDINADYRIGCHIGLIFNPVTFCDDRDNTRVMSYTEFERKISYINELMQTEFEFMGIAPIYDWQVTRLDLSKYIEINQPYSDYMPVFEQIRPRQNLIKNIYPQSTIYFTAKNSKNQTARTFHIKIENKNKQLFDQKIIAEKRNENLLQVEIKMEKAATIKAKSKEYINTLNDLMQPSQKLIEDVFKDVVHNYLFYDNTLPVGLYVQNSLNDLKMIKKLKKDGKHNAILYMLALQNTPNHFDYIGLKEHAKDTYNIKSLERQIKEFQKYRNFYKRTATELPSNILYSELYNKIFDLKPIQTTLE